jgi:hypothetical protein
MMQSFLFAPPPLRVPHDPPTLNSRILIPNPVFGLEYKSRSYALRNFLKPPTASCLLNPAHHFP